MSVEVKLDITLLMEVEEINMSSKTCLNSQRVMLIIRMSGSEKKKSILLKHQWWTFVSNIQACQITITGHQSKLINRIKTHSVSNADPSTVSPPSPNFQLTQSPSKFTWIGFRSVLEPQWGSTDQVLSLMTANSFSWEREPHKIACLATTTA